MGDNKSQNLALAGRIAAVEKALLDMPPREKKALLNAGLKDAFDKLPKRDREELEAEMKNFCSIRGIGHGAMLELAARLGWYLNKSAFEGRCNG